MKKLVMNFITIILLIFTSTNFIFAEKFLCKVEKGYYGIYVHLILYNDVNEELSEELIILNPNKLNDNQKYVLDLMEGIEINDQERWYEQIMNLKDQLENVKQGPLQPYYAQQVRSLHSEIFKILGCKLYELGYGL